MMHWVGICAIFPWAWVLAFIPWPVRNTKAAMWKLCISTHPFSMWTVAWSWDKEKEPAITQTWYAHDFSTNHINEHHSPTALGIYISLYALTGPFLNNCGSEFLCSSKISPFMSKYGGFWDRHGNFGHQNYSNHPLRKSKSDFKIHIHNWTMILGSAASANF